MSESNFRRKFTQFYSSEWFRKSIRRANHVLDPNLAVGNSFVNAVIPKS